MAPTSFPSGIAIPHSIKNDALQSGVSIMTLQEPIYWNDVKVKIIALVAISKKRCNRVQTISLKKICRNCLRTNQHQTFINGGKLRGVHPETKNDDGRK